MLLPTSLVSRGSKLLMKGTDGLIDASFMGMSAGVQQYSFFPLPLTLLSCHLFAI
jgi:hypothetical protein